MKNNYKMFQPRGDKFFVAIILVLTVLGGTSQAANQVGKNFCFERTGLAPNDVESVRFRNENCTIDCIMRQGLVMSYYQEDGISCWNSKDASYKCVLGVCRDSDAQKMASFSDLYALEISVISAHVPDMDDIPGAGGSDVFVTIEVANDGFPTYKPGDIVCFTYVIQDNNRPRWNFTCKPLPMTSETKLRFRALDSDKPFSLNPDRLGVASENVATLMAKGRTKMRLISPQIRAERPYYLEVEVKGKKYQEQNREE